MGPDKAIEWLKSVVHEGHIPTKDELEAITYLSGVQRVQSWGMLGCDNQVSFMFGGRLYSEEAWDKYHIPPGPVSEPDFSRLLDLCVDEMLQDYLASSRLHRWLKQQVGKTEPNLIKDYAYAHVEMQSKRAQKYIELFDTMPRLHYFFTRNPQETQDDAKEYLANRIAIIRELAAYGKGDALTPEIIRLSATAFITRRMDLGGFLDEFGEPMHEKLEEIDKKTIGWMQHFFMANHMPALPQDIARPLMEMLIHFGITMHYGDSELDARTEAMENAAERIIQLVYFNSDLKSCKVSKEMITDTVKGAFNRRLPGLMLDINTPDDPQGYVGGRVVLPPDCLISDILNAGRKSPKARGDEHFPSDFTP